jgi:hypothetical protein
VHPLDLVANLPASSTDLKTAAAKLDITRKGLS